MVAFGVDPGELMPDFLDIPGLTELRRKTRGDSEIRVAMIDGDVDQSHPCFAGINMDVIENYWSSNDCLETEQQEFYRRHATFVASVLFGQPNTQREGIAPYSTALPINVALKAGSSIPELDLTRAIDAARDCGADVIHVSMAMPTLSGKTDELLAKSIQHCLDENIIVIAPAGNDSGACQCIPAALPGVLAVGALTEAGRPFGFSNWGGIYQTQGITAPGENIEAAKPGWGTVVENGTSCAAAIVSGIAALLLAMQKSQGREPNGYEVYRALIDSADVGDSAWLTDEEKCRYLAGKLNITDAMRQLLFTG
jgi:cyanobactin maturation PatA/PatG family protease